MGHLFRRLYLALQNHSQEHIPPASSSSVRGYLRISSRPFAFSMALAFITSEAPLETLYSMFTPI